MAEALEGDDINTAFDSIVMLEQKVSADGFREGFERGQQIGTEEGYRLGHRHGLELGSELGFYRGTATAWLAAGLPLSEKSCAAVTRLAGLLDAFPSVVQPDMEIGEDVARLRAAYKKACSLLKVEPLTPVAAKLSF